MDKDLKGYAWTLYSGLADGTVTMKDLIKMVFHCWQKEVSFSMDEDDDKLYFRNSFLYGYCGCFAAALFRKQYLKGHWTYENGTFDQNGQIVTMDEIDRFYETIRQQSPEYVKEFMVNWFDAFRHFDRKTETFQLAVFDHCTEENIVAAFIMTDFFSESRDGTPEELKRWERTSPPCPDPGQVAHHLGVFTWEAYAYDYLESTIPNVSSELHSASERVEEAETFAEAVYAAIEYEFWLEITLTLPYTAYLLLTGDQ